MNRMIKRYANRKLYDTKESRYVTLEQIAELIREGEDVKVIDNNSKEDLTSITLAQIIFEEEKRQRSFLPLSALRRIIQSGGESWSDLLSQLSLSAERVGRVFRSEHAGDGEQGAEATAPDPAGAPGPDTADSGGGEKIIPEWADPTRYVSDLVEGVQGVMEEGQRRIDTNIHGAMESLSPLAPIQKEVRALGERLASLEELVAQLERVSKPPEHRS